MTGSYKKARALALAVALLSGLCWKVVPVHAQQPQIWMGATEPVWRRVHHWPQNDFMQLFKPGARWTKVSSILNVWQVSKRFVLEASRSELSRVIVYLKLHHISLAIQGTPLLGVKGCGLGVEGHGPPDDMRREAERIRKLGGTIKYIANDEPLYYGHEFLGRGRSEPCIAPIPVLMEQVAAKLTGVREVFPDVQVGDVEPVGVGYPASNIWLSDIRTWIRAYANTIPGGLAFFRLDVVRQRSTWVTQLGRIIKTLRSEHIPISMIYNGTRKDRSDEAWSRSAAKLYDYVEGQLGITPAQAVFQSWMDRPRRLLPEREPGTLTHLVLEYALRNRQ